jgi:hypothetical protein
MPPPLSLHKYIFNDTTPTYTTTTLPCTDTTTTQYYVNSRLYGHNNLIPSQLSESGN